MPLKEKSKIIGWDDGPFEFNQEEKVPVIGAVTRGGDHLDGIIKTGVEVDGLKGTSRLSSAINESKHKRDLSLIMLDGITLGGYNVIDIEALAERTELPVLATTRKRVDLDSFRAGLKKLPEFESRWEAVLKAGEITKMNARGSEIYYQKSRLTREEANRAISITATHSTTPEPLRLADIIAKSLVHGES
ncbi:MAG: DUF99 family protein [Candidatus Bipolaricaulia bacterium]